MRKNGRLRRYLTSYLQGGPDWSRRYEASLDGDGSYPWLTGHYSGALKDLVDLLGAERIAALIDALATLDDEED